MNLTHIIEDINKISEDKDFEKIKIHFDDILDFELEIFWYLKSNGYSNLCA